MKKLQLSTAISCIQKRGALLVFPINNREMPPSLWLQLFPKSRMVWDWNEDADSRVAELWRLMKELSTSRQVVYSKWFQGRATFFSPELFTAMLRIHASFPQRGKNLSEAARSIFEVLENNSPLSTRELKRAADLQGRLNEAVYSRAMKELFTRLLIVGFGEVEDGAFPSAAVGATELLFGDLWLAAEDLSIRNAQAIVDGFLPEGSHFRRFFERTHFLESKKNVRS